MKKNSYITITDQFCGAGGSSQGARKCAKRLGCGLEIKLALNHWKLAIETHNTNFPDTIHDCTDISASDPRRYPSTNILIASPECTNHSLAKGKKQLKAQMYLFEKGIIDPAAERSRATMWDVPRFAEFHNYEIVIAENVVDARKWIMWEAWLKAMHLLGYDHKCVYLNSMHCHPTPQSRDRMYVVFWKKGNTAPDLEYRPQAFCNCCSKNVYSFQSWRNPQKKYGKYKQQYDYRCPVCASVVEPYYYAAFNVVDWTIPGMRIGDRAKELSPKTLERIRYGLDKHGNSEFIVYLDHSQAGHLVSGINDPIRTQTTAQVAAVVSSVLIKNYGGALDPKHANISMNKPASTITTQDHHGIVGIPAMLSKGGYDGGVCPIKDPSFTMTTQHNFGVIGKPFIVANYGTSKANAIDNPIGAITAGGINHGILSTESVNAFLSYYYGNSQSTDIVDPSGTITTKDRIGIVLKPTGKIDINDCTYRMLKPHEIQAAMAFESDYVVCGNSRDKVKQLGNAVTPPAMEWLVERCVESLNS